MGKPKKQVFKKWEDVALLAHRQVVKVGYEIDIDSILDDMLDETGDTRYRSKMGSRSPCDRTVEALTIWRRHPAFAEVRQKILALEPEVEQGWMKLSMPTAYEQAAGLCMSPGMECWAERLVMAAAKYRLRQKLHHGAKRELFFGRLDESWVGPHLTVCDKKTVRTGTYVSGGRRNGGYDDDDDLPSLRHTGTHVLLEVCRYGMYGNDARWVMAEDCVPWKQRERMMKVAEVMMEEPL